MMNKFWKRYSQLALNDQPKASQPKTKRSPREYFPCENSYLTRREAECVYFLLQGLTFKQIGKQLGLSHRTIEFYLKNLKIRMGYKDRHQLLAAIKQSQCLNQLQFNK